MSALFFTSPLGGEVGERSEPGEGARAYRDSLSPSPQPSPRRGEEVRPNLPQRGYHASC